MPDSSTMSLLLLLYSLGGFKVQERILFRGLFPQKRWNDSGNMYNITLLDAGLNQQCAHLFSAQTTLEHAIKSCVQHRMIMLNEVEDDSLAYSLADEFQISFEHEHMLQGLIFITHIYPREVALHDS
jgi:hypothetical protein